MAAACGRNAPGSDRRIGQELAKPASDSSDLRALNYESLHMADSAARPASTADTLKGAKAFAATQRFVQAVPEANAQAVFADQPRRRMPCWPRFNWSKRALNCESLMAMARFTAAPCSLRMLPGARVRPRSERPPLPGPPERR